MVKQKSESISQSKTLKVVLEDCKSPSEGQLPKKAQLIDATSKKRKRKNSTNSMKTEQPPENICQNMTTPSNSKRIKTLQKVIYKNKYFPEEYLPKKTKLVESILEQKKKSLNLSTVLHTDDEEEIADNVRRDLLEEERKRIFSSVPSRRRKRKTLIKSESESEVPLDVLQASRLKEVLSKLSSKEKPVKLNFKVKSCITSKDSTSRGSWRSPGYLLSTIVECLLKRKWNILPYLILELININKEHYKPIIRLLYEVCDQHHPVIREHGLKGKHKDIKRRQKIGSDTTIV
uniref:Uncharacterized protein LOC114331359 n=1 Tax=Diabrotica virgifera virgifera TaxID=50390 RepID=A0A6P7FPL1_DIAVI